MPTLQTFLQLKTKLRNELWPDGEASNLVSSHNKLFVEALIDLQRWITCLQLNNLTVYPACSILFRCGQSVITVPEKAQIYGVRTYDRISSTTCREDADAPINYCSEVTYKYVAPCRLRVIMERMLCNTVLGQSCGYPVPTNADYAGFPELPLGYVYPQSSLDRSCTSILAGCCTPRARAGIWSYENGRIYLSPWLQSTEIIIVQWAGIRRTWVDSDLCLDFADYEAAVKAYVAWKHYLYYERDAGLDQAFMNEYYDERRMLIHDCREETRDHTCEPLLASQSLETLQGQSTGVIDGVATPQSLTVSNVSETEVTLNWVDVSGCTVTFIVERSLDGVTWTEVATTAACVTEYTDSGLDAGVQYYYRITATDGASDSVPTPAVSVTTSGTTSTTTTTPPPPSTLINVAFLFSGATTKTGAAAVGQGGDIWNSFISSIGSGYLDLNYADGASSGARMQDVGSPGGSYGDNGNSDAMLKKFLVKNTFPYTKQFVISDLPAGTYSLYLYGWSNEAGTYVTGSCTIQKASGHWTVANSSSGPIISGTKIVGTNDNPPFIETPGQVPGTCPTVGNYSRVASFVIGAGENLYVTCSNPASGHYGVISGLQLVKL